MFAACCHSPPKSLKPTTLNYPKNSPLIYLDFLTGVVLILLGILAVYDILSISAGGTYALIALGAFELGQALLQSLCRKMVCK